MGKRDNSDGMRAGVHRGCAPNARSNHKRGNGSVGNMYVLGGTCRPINCVNASRRRGAVNLAHRYAGGVAGSIGVRGASVGGEVDGHAICRQLHLSCGFRRAVSLRYAQA